MTMTSVLVAEAVTETIGMSFKRPVRVQRRTFGVKDTVEGNNDRNRKLVMQRYRSDGYKGSQLLEMND